MRAVLVGVIGKTKKLYYVIDASSQNSDGVYDDGEKPTVVNFWQTAMNEENLVPLRTAKFHDWLWDGLDGDESDRWKRVFVNKTQNIDPELLKGIPVSTDVMKSKTKQKDLTSRAFEFKTLLQTQITSMIRKKTGRQ